MVSKQSNATFVNILLILFSTSRFDTLQSFVLCMENKTGGATGKSLTGLNQNNGDTGPVFVKFKNSKFSLHCHEFCEVATFHMLYEVRV